MILPFEGQQDLNAKPKKANGGNASSSGQKKTKGPASLTQVRQQISQPSGKLSTNNVGIKETLNPTQRKVAGGSGDINSSLKEDFTYERLQHVWKEYSLGVKRERKDSLYSTLVKSKMTMSSDYQIQLEIINTVQAAELEREKVEILGFLRKKLRNYSIGLKYSLIESKKIQIMDSKGTFDKLAEENTSLNKFRKLFNLDIEF